MGWIERFFEFIGIVTVIWFVWIAREEYIKIREREESDKGR